MKSAESKTKVLLLVEDRFSVTGAAFHTFPNPHRRHAEGSSDLIDLSDAISSGQSELVPNESTMKSARESYEDGGEA